VCVCVFFFVKEIKMKHESIEKILMFRKSCILAISAQYFVEGRIQAFKQNL
jgi:hypothetical protein